MLWVFLSFQAFTQVLALSEVPPPQDVHIGNGLLTWTKKTEERELFYTVQSRSILDTNWKSIPACVQIAVNFCNVTATKIHADHGCVMLRVQTVRHELTSIPVLACSSQGEPCTPQFSLTARPGSLTVHLNGDHCLVQDYGTHVKHRIFWGKKGESLKEHADVASSLTIKELEEGQQYCAKVQYVKFKKTDGLPSSVQCESIPFSEVSRYRTAKATSSGNCIRGCLERIQMCTEPIKVIKLSAVHCPFGLCRGLYRCESCFRISDSKEKKIAAGVVTILLFVILIIGIVYICIFHRRTIKHWMQPPCEIPDVFLQPISEKHKSMLISSPVDEQCDVLSIKSEGRIRAVQ